MACAAILLLSPAVIAQTIIDQSAGSLTWSNENVTGEVTIEWAPNLDGAWYSDWSNLQDIPSTQTTASAEVPAFYRVNGTTTRVERVHVGQPGNLPDSNSFGSVSYQFRIGKYEISNKQYADFLNTVDPQGSNTYSLFKTESNVDGRAGIMYIATNSPGARYVIKTNMTDKPVVFVTFWSACRFCNWLHNGQGTETELGAYDLAGIANLNNVNITRNPRARFFLPNEDEWYKAAYYKGTSSNYYLYPTSSNSPPATANTTDSIPVGSVINFNNPNVANYNLGADWNGLDGNLISVGGAGTNSLSPYKAADMGGNVSEWTESYYSTGPDRVYRGGSWFSSEGALRNSARNGDDPDTAINSRGFRVASPY